MHAHTNENTNFIQFSQYTLTTHKHTTEPSPACLSSTSVLSTFSMLLLRMGKRTNERTKQQPESEMNQTREEEKNHIYNITHTQNNSQFAQFYSVVWLHKSMCLCSQFVYIFRMLAFDCVECNVLSSL